MRWTSIAMHNTARSKSGMLLSTSTSTGSKQTNDRHGHEVGSMLIRRFAELLTETFRQSDVVARVGGDEFVVLARGDAERAPELLARLQQNVTEDNNSTTLPSGHFLQRRAQRARAARDCPDRRLMANADAIMYEQKRLKRKAA